MWPFKKSKVKEDVITRIMEEAEAEGFNELGLKNLESMLKNASLINPDADLQDIMYSVEGIRSEEYDSQLQQVDKTMQDLLGTIKNLEEPVDKTTEEIMETEIRYDEIACEALGITRTEYEIFMRIQCVCPDRNADGFCRKKRGKVGVGKSYTDEVCHIACPRVKEVMKEIRNSDRSVKE